MAALRGIEGKYDEKESIKAIAMMTLNKISRTRTNHPDVCNLDGDPAN